MKKKIVAFVIGAALGLAAFEGLTAHAATVRAEEAEKTIRESYVLEMQDPGLWIHFGTITEAVHTADFTGYVKILDNGREYYGNFDAEDFEVGDHVVFATVPCVPGDWGAWEPWEVDVIRAHCIPRTFNDTHIAY